MSDHQAIPDFNMPHHQINQEFDQQYFEQVDRTSDQPLNQLHSKNHLELEPQAAKQPTQCIDNLPISTPHSDGHSIKPLTKPDNYDHIDRPPTINPNENLENAFKSNYLYMMNEFKRGDLEKADKMAHELLTWAELPILYRTYAHIQVLAYRPTDHLFHACKAVEEAEWGLENYDDQQGVATRLLAAANSTLVDIRADAASRVHAKENDHREQNVEEMD